MGTHRVDVDVREKSKAKIKLERVEGEMRKKKKKKRPVKQNLLLTTALSHTPGVCNDVHIAGIQDVKLL